MWVQKKASTVVVTFNLGTCNKAVNHFNDAFQIKHVEIFYNKMGYGIQLMFYQVATVFSSTSSKSTCYYEIISSVIYRVSFTQFTIKFMIITNIITSSLDI